MNREEFEILDHTINRASARLYCGDSGPMQRLVAAGLMEPAGFKSFVPDPYFRVTKLGREAWNANRPPAKAVTRSQQRYRDFLRSDTHMTFIQWLTRKTK